MLTSPSPFWDRQTGGFVAGELQLTGAFRRDDTTPSDRRQLLVREHFLQNNLKEMISLMWQNQQSELHCSCQCSIRRSVRGLIRSLVRIPGDHGLETARLPPLDFGVSARSAGHARGGDARGSAGIPLGMELGGRDK